MIRSVLLLLLPLFTLPACVHEPLAPLPDDRCLEALSYQVDILPIIQASCNMGACHAGAYQTYEGLEPKLWSGAFADRVFERRGDPVLGMPPSSATYPYAQFDTLSDAQLELLRCWVRQGYPR